MSRPPACPLCGERKAELVALTSVHLGEDRGERFEWVRCMECRLVRLARPLGPEELQQYYGPGYLPHLKPKAWGRGAPLVRWSERIRDRARVRLVERYLKPALGADPSLTRVLDVGCGRPSFLRTLTNRAGWQGTGLDTTDSGWKEGGPNAWGNLELKMGELGSSGLAPGSFALVTLWHVLEHLSDPRKSLEQLLELTLPGGILVVEVPDFGSIPRRLQGRNWIGFDSPRHLFAFDRNTLRRALEDAGWEVEEVRREGSMDPWVLWWLGSQVKKGGNLAGDLRKAILPFIAGKVVTWPIASLGRWLPLGAMTAVARRAA